MAIAPLSVSRALAPVLTTERGMLFHADCLDLFAQIRSGSVDCVFADPPFNLGKNYGEGSEKDLLRETD